jgi:hypothetical protein
LIARGQQCTEQYRLQRRRQAAAICPQAVTQLQQNPQNINLFKALHWVEIRCPGLFLNRSRCAALDKGRPEGRRSRGRFDQV